MNKTDLVQQVAESAHLSNEQASRAVSAVFNGMEQALAGGEDVVILGFGSFDVVDRAPRVGRHPKTGERIDIPATRQVRFKAGKNLKESVE